MCFVRRHTLSTMTVPGTQPMLSTRPTRRVGREKAQRERPPEMLTGKGPTARGPAQNTQHGLPLPLGGAPECPGQNSKGRATQEGLKPGGGGGKGEGQDQHRLRREQGKHPEPTAAGTRKEELRHVALMARPSPQEWRALLWTSRKTRIKRFKRGDARVAQ